MGTIEEQLTQMEREEQELQFSEFTNETALQVGLRIVEEAKRNNKNIAVDITRSGQRLFVHAMEGTTVRNENWIRRKNNVVARFAMSSRRFAVSFRNQDKTLEELYGISEEDYAPAGGSFPLTVKGEGIIGTITVSGLPDHEDHEIVVKVVREYLSERR